MGVEQLPQTDADRRAQIKQEAERQRQAIRANGIKEGYSKRDGEWFKALGVSSMDEAREITGLRARPTLSEEQKHGRFRFWQGVAAGTFVTMITLGLGMAIYTRSVMDPAFDAAARMQMQQDVVSTLRQGAEP